jgi:hypothetical protein
MDGPRNFCERFGAAGDRDDRDDRDDGIVLARALIPGSH